MCVDTDLSRSCMESTYDSSTAPPSTSSRPASVIASSRVVARPRRTIDSSASISPAPSSGSSAAATAPPSPLVRCSRSTISS